MTTLRRPNTLFLPLCLALGSTGCGEATTNAATGTGGMLPGGAAGSAGATTGGAASGGAASGGLSASGGSAGVVGASGATATGGTAQGGSGGTTPMAGSAGVVSMAGGGAGAGAPAGGAGGAAGSAGSGGAGAGGMPVQGNCTFTVESSLSKAIATVGIVDWTTDLPGVTAANIVFTLDNPMADELNVGDTAPAVLTGSPYRTLLLGLKPQRGYTFHIEATAGATACSSQDYTLTTGAVGAGLPQIDREVPNAAGRARGFIITSTGIAGFGGGGGGGTPMAFILDADGDVVWWAAAPASCSRARMSYEGTDMWMLELNVDNMGGEMSRASMDGLDTEDNVAGLAETHHDFTVLPGGIIAAPSWVSGGMDPPSDLIERSPDGTIATRFTIDEGIYQSNTYHANAINYLPEEDAYTIGDRNPNLFVKVTRQGQLLWQFGGNCNDSPAPKCAGGDWQVNHGHHLLPNGNFLFFNNGSGGGDSAVFEYTLTETADALMATPVWDYTSDVNSMVLGDAQRLPNGNTLVTYSFGGVLHEVNAERQLVQSFSAGAFGYSEFRTTLYGPPPR